MPALKKEMINETLEELRVVYLTRAISKWWNTQRSSDDPPIFCGWFWVRGRQEGGPFHTRSAALRDGFYRFVAHRQLPTVWNEKIPRKLVSATAQGKAPVRAKKKRRSSTETRPTP